ncbi:hypothetical protein B0H13DRAFT_1926275 [Mycena leptocephala]|nr:hypothetical protein B0H13DRAFT_1926275 [Mycena leptocephala]
MQTSACRGWSAGDGGWCAAVSLRNECTMPWRLAASRLELQVFGQSTNPRRLDEIRRVVDGLGREYGRGWPSVSLCNPDTWHNERLNSAQFRGQGRVRHLNCATPDDSRTSAWLAGFKSREIQILFESKHRLNFHNSRLPPTKALSASHWRASDRRSSGALKIPSVYSTHGPQLATGNITKSVSNGIFGRLPRYMDINVNATMLQTGKDCKYESLACPMLTNSITNDGSLCSSGQGTTELELEGKWENSKREKTYNLADSSLIWGDLLQRYALVLMLASSASPHATTVKQALLGVQNRE